MDENCVFLVETPQLIFLSSSQAIEASIQSLKLKYSKLLTLI